MGLRAQDPVPDWISHLAVVKDDRISTGPKNEVLALEVARASTNKQSSQRREVHDHLHQSENRKVLVELKNVSVSYHERKASIFALQNQMQLTICVQVLKNIHWTIRAGDRSHLQGSNGKFLPLPMKVADVPDHLLWQAQERRPCSLLSRVTILNHTPKFLQNQS
jgi:hypothetical protein